MWQLHNHTPFSATRGWTLDKDGRSLWVVTAKASYCFADGAPPQLSACQPEPSLAPSFTGAVGCSSLLFEAEHGPPKPCCDVIVHAYAYAPDRAATEVETRLRVGDAIDKGLRVYGDRRYQLHSGSLRLDDPEPFERVPICYEKAYGGPGWPANPIGVGHQEDPRALVGTLAPAVETIDDVPEPTTAGLGPIPAYWSPRAELAGRYDARWHADKRPLLPDDHDPRHACCAPLDQQAQLVGGEQVELLHLTPSGRLAFHLPALDLRSETTICGRVREDQARLTTVAIDAERGTLALIWQVAFTVAEDRVDYLDACHLHLSSAP